MCVRTTIHILFAGMALTCAAEAVEVEVVIIDDPGNPSDTRYPSTPLGSVGYDFWLGKYEVTNGQYTEFLNDVAGVDTYGLYSTEMWSADAGCKIERFAGLERRPILTGIASRPIE